MKKLNLIIALLCVVEMVNAQRTIDQQVPVNFKANKVVTDTVMPTHWNEAGLTYYTTNDASGNFAGFVAGINTYADMAKIQEYDAGTGHSVEGALIVIPVKVDNDSVNADNGSFNFSVYTFDADTPSVVAAAKTVLYADMDTTGYTVAMLDAPVAVSGKYGAGIDMSATFDVAGILSLYTLATTTNGDAQGGELNWEQWSDGSMNKMSTSWAAAPDILDIDLAIFPVINLAPNSIEDANFLNGVKVSCYPNPTTDVLNISYAIENSADVNIKVAGLNGQVVMELAEGFKTAGQFTSSLNVNSLANGTYFVTVEAGSSRIAQRIVVQ